MSEFNVVGHPIKRGDALEKSLGRAVYAGDLSFPGMLYGKVFLSAHPHARIISVDTSPALALPGVRAVLTAKDIPGINRFGLAVPDQRVLAEGKVRSMGDPVAVVAADTLEIAGEAVKRIKVEYEPLPGVFGLLEALEPGAPGVHEGGNLLQHTKVRKGDVEKGFAEAGVVVENTYRTQAQEHAYIEPEVSVALFDGAGNLTVHASTQYPFRDRRQIAPVLGIPVNRVRVIQATTGGAFGGKDDVTTEILTSLLAQKTGRPVKLSFTREESFRGTTKRHPMIIKCRTGAAWDGKLTAVDGDVYGDTGAYCSLGIYIVKKCGIHLAGPYFVPNIRVDTYTVYTNNTIFGPMRGFGVIQAAFVHESQMDLLAARLGISPVEIRMKNALDAGLSTATGQVLKQSVGFKETIRKVREYLDANPLEGGDRRS